VITENINDRIFTDYDSVCGDVEKILGEVNMLRSNQLFIAALGDDSALKMSDNCDVVKRRLRDAFNVVVVGDFKRGKSTLINALIGSDVLPTAVTPETVTINRISYSETPRVEAVMKNGKRKTLSHDGLRREAIEEEAKTLPAKIDYVDIRANVEILKEISIVDTPGIGDLFKIFDREVAAYLVNADALIYVISVKAPLSMTERAFLSTAVMPLGFARVLAVVNMADTLETPENVQKITEYTKDRAQVISPDIYVYTLSALDELCRRKGEARPEPGLAPMLEANFLEFEAALNTDIIQQKNIIKSTRALALTRILLDDIANRISLVKNSLRTNVEKLQSNEDEFKNENSDLMKSIEKRKSELGADIDIMRREAKSWMAEFMSRLKAETGGIEKSVEVSDLEKHFQFFMSDNIKDAIISCVERHQKDISDRISDITKSMSTKIAESAFGGVNAKIAENVADISWTSMDSLMFYGDAIGWFIGDDLLGPVHLIAQAITGFIRQSEVSKKQSDFLTPILQGFDSLSDDVIKNTDAVYENLKLTAIDRLQETFQSQIDASLSAITSAKRIALDENVKAEDVAKYLDSVLSKLKEYGEVLDKYN